MGESSSAPMGVGGWVCVEVEREREMTVVV